MNETLEMIQNYAASGKYKRVPVSRELYADAFTPISVMRTLRAASRHCYLLESAEDRQQWGRYSFLGYAPTMEITCMDGKVVILEGNEEDEKIKREVRTDHPGKILREILKDYKSPVVPGLPPFTGGLVGYFSYDYIKYGEPSLKPILNGASENDFRDADLMLFDRVIVFDNYRQKLILITGVRLDGDLEENYENAQRELEEMERLIRSGAKAVFKPLKLEEEFQPGAEKAEYCRMVEKAKEYIREGDIFQVVLSNPLTAKAKGSLFAFAVSGHRIRHLICSTSQVTISKWQELRRKRLRSLKMERSAPSRWQEQDPVERRRRKIRGWNENCWQMKKNWQNITCL